MTERQGRINETAVATTIGTTIDYKAADESQ